MAQTTAEALSGKYWPEPPSKKFIATAAGVSLASRFIGATQLPRLTMEHALQIGQSPQFGIGSEQLNNALHFWNTVNTTVGHVAPLDFLPAALFIGSRYLDPEHYDPKPVAPSWFKSALGGLSTLVESGADAFALPILRSYPELAQGVVTGLLQHTITKPELILAGTETTIAAIAVYSFIETGKRVWDWLTYPNLQGRREKKAEAIKRSRASFKDAIKPPQLPRRTDEQILADLQERRRKHLRGQLDKIMEETPSNKIFDARHKLIQNVLRKLRGQTENVPDFIQDPGKSVSNRLNKLKR